MRIFQRIHQKLNWSRRRYVSVIVGLLALGYLSSAIYHTYKTLCQRAWILVVNCVMPR